MVVENIIHNGLHYSIGDKVALRNPNMHSNIASGTISEMNSFNGSTFLKLKSVKPGNGKHLSRGMSIYELNVSEVGILKKKCSLSSDFNIWF